MAVKKVDEEQNSDFLVTFFVVQSESSAVNAGRFLDKIARR